MPPVGLRWTIGDVSDAGFEALKLSIWGAWRIFGAAARYTVCVNSVPLVAARSRTGPLPDGIDWRLAEGEFPPALSQALDRGMAEGVAWKFLPLRVHPDRYEIALDNDCILWRMPSEMAGWLGAADGETCLLAADVRCCFGQFADLCGERPRNTGIRGLPPHFDLGKALAETLSARPVRLTSELDEQGLQVAALNRRRQVRTVGVDDVSICSPFYPHDPEPGRCGAHLVGLNARDIPWRYYDRPAIECRLEHWQRLRPRLYRAVGLRPEATTVPPAVSR